jgi:hypothetical protein
LIDLPGKTWAVYLVVLFRSRLERSPSVSITTATLKRFRLTRNDKDRALRSLEKAGLVRVKRQNGKNPVITIL